MGLAMLAMRNENGYHGFARHDFKVGGLEATVVDPKRSAKGRPWIWRMEFFDHRPMLDLALLERGYHLAYVNVGNTYGSPGAIHQLSEFYQALVGPAWKLNPRVVLEGFSRGGLYAYNWAVKNPSKVMAIYGDAPVCDFTTWPYGGAGAARSESDWGSLVSLYGFPTEADALTYAFPPVANLDVLVQAKIPIVHVIGDADEVVPVAANTALIESRYRALWGTILVIHKPGGLHHPHSLDDPIPLVAFLTRHANDSEASPPSTIIAAPGLETRSSSAGWGTRSWVQEHQDGMQAAQAPGVELALLGDSITQGFGGVYRQVGEPGGESRRKWLENGHPLANLGISGECVQNVLWRVKHGALRDSSAKVVLIMVGINNYPSSTPGEVVRGLESLSGEVTSACPKALVAVQPLLPSGPSAKSEVRVWCESVNQGLATSARRHQIRLAFPDHHYLLDPDGSQNPELVSGDGIHLLPKGYDLWAQAIQAAVKKMTTP